MNYISLDTATRPLRRLSWDFLARVSGVTTEEYIAAYKRYFGRFNFDVRPFAEGIQCPFGERDLMNDTCYLGSGVHRCKYFVRYSHDEPHKNCIVCSHPKKEKIIYPTLF